MTFIVCGRVEVVGDELSILILIFFLIDNGRLLKVPDGSLRDMTLIIYVKVIVIGVKFSISFLITF